MNGSHKVTVIIPYFGRLPSWMSLWMKSCEANTNYSWVILTDAPNVPGNVPGNVSFVPSTLREIKARAEAVLGFEICLRRPYKVCDLRVAFGAMFPEHIADSSHWAFSDVDVIYGRLDHFFRVPEHEQYLRLFRRGHFTIFKNTKEANELFKLSTPDRDIRRAMKTPRVRYFDELRGLCRVMTHHGIPTYHEEVIADIDWRKDPMVKMVDPNYPLQVFYYERGAMYQGYWTGSEFARKEWAYIHFQKRPMKPPSFDPQDVESWYITPNGFVPKSGDPSSAEETQSFNAKQTFFRGRRILYGAKRLAALV